jgi:hypothetical protein
MKKWKRLRPFDLFARPQRVTVTRSPAGCFASDGVVLWDLGYWEPNPVTDSLRDGGSYQLRARRADQLDDHADDLVAKWRQAVGAGPDGYFQARRTTWSCRGFALWAVPHTEHGVFPLLIDDSFTEMLRGQYFRIFADKPESRHALITCGYDVIGAVRPLQLDPCDEARADARLLAERFGNTWPHQWPTWGPV